MKKLLISSIAVLGLIGAPAFAADMAVKAPPPVPAPVYNWTGVYLGASLGWRRSDSTWTTTTPFVGSILPSSVELDSATFRAGAYIGYNWQVSQTWLIGLEGDIASGSSSKSNAGFPGACFTAGCGAFDTITLKGTWDASIRGRIGFLVTPTWLLYVTGGGAFERTQMSAFCNGSGGNASFCGIVIGASTSTVRDGWTIGGGVEAMIAPHWFARAEYRHAAFGGTQSLTLPPAPAAGWTANANLKTNTDLVGLAYKF